jgi:hypothetical protein
MHGLYRVDGEDSRYIDQFGRALTPSESSSESEA